MQEITNPLVEGYYSLPWTARKTFRSARCPTTFIERLNAIIEQGMYASQLIDLGACVLIDQSQSGWGGRRAGRPRLRPLPAA
jgi:hypothetical protein